MIDDLVAFTNIRVATERFARLLFVASPMHGIGFFRVKKADYMKESNTNAPFYKITAV